MRTRDAAHFFVPDHANTVIFEETQTERRTSDEQSDFSEDTDESEEEDSVVLEDEDVSRIFPAGEDSEEEYYKDVNEVSRRDVAIVGEEIGSEEY
uniref:Uncharacterized protein n=1 Tax=Caenorhabditis japonica TaxID=281687 RepID=A0A8R1IQN0_CAEJA